MAMIRGVDKKQQMARHTIFRDTRPFMVQLLDDLRSPEATLFVFGGLVLLTGFYPAMFETTAILAPLLYLMMRKTVIDIPFRKRKSLHELDDNDLHPGTGKPQMSRGIGFLANRVGDDMEIWVANEDLRTHMFIIGSTGAGKTESLLSLAYNPLTWGSGYSYADGKGDVSFWGKHFGLARSFGREDDVLAINYMTAGADTTQLRWDKLSNTYNPYQMGNADSSLQLTTSLMDASGSGGDMWKGRAISYLSTLISPLNELRDQGILMLHIGVIRAHMPFNRYVELMNNERISERSRRMMEAFLADVPGYDGKKPPEKQNSTFTEQYGYQQMQFTRIMSSLADTYGHIFAAKQAEVNLKDVALNCRLLAVLLPALEKSRPELGNLGKIVVAGKKNMMGTQLGGRIEGSRRELIDARATNSPSPYLMIFDEFGYFMPEDSALMWAQARSLGFALVAAGQDIQAFYRTSKEETLAIFSNSNIKVLGKLEDPTDTFDLFAKHAAEAYVTEMDGFEIKKDSVMGDYRANSTARVNKVSRLDMLDLKDQIEGQVHIFVRSEIIRARMFYADPITPEELRPNYFVEVLAPTDEEVASRLISPEEIMDSLTELHASPPSCNDDLSFVPDLLMHKQYEHYQSQKQGAEAGIALFIMLHDVSAYALPVDPATAVEAETSQQDTTAQNETTTSSTAHERKGSGGSSGRSGGSGGYQNAPETPECAPESFEVPSASSQDIERPVDPLVAGVVEEAAPLLKTILGVELLFDTPEQQAEVMSSLQDLAKHSGYSADDANSVIDAAAQSMTAASLTADPEESKRRMDSAMSELERLMEM